MPRNEFSYQYNKRWFSMSKKSMKFLEFASKTTVTNYKSSIGKYEEFHGTTIDELVDEALTEQAERVPHHQLSIGLTFGYIL